MTKTNAVLISAVGGDIGGSVARSCRSLKRRLIGCDVRDVLIPGGVLDGFHRVPAARDPDAYFAAIKRIIAREGVGTFIPVSEPEIKLLHEHRGRLGSLGARVLLNNEKVLDNFLDKLSTVRFLKELEIPVPRTALLKDYDGAFGYPLIVKARLGCGGKRRWKIEDAADLDHIRRKDDGTLIAQEHLGSEEEEYTTGIFSDGRKVSSITFRRRLGFGGLSTEAVLVRSPYLDGICRTIAESVRLAGSINLQSRRVGKVFYPFEINPRLSSTLLFRKKFGFDDCVWWVRLLEGKGYAYRPAYRAGRAVRRLTEDYFDLERPR